MNFDLQNLNLMVISLVITFLYVFSVDRGGNDELSMNSVLHKNYNTTTKLDY